MKIDKEQLLELWNAHCRNQYPREFCAINVVKDKKKAIRNIRISDANILYNFVETWEFRDVYISVYPFKKWHEKSDMRKQFAIVNTLFLDFDHEENPKIAFKEAKKLVNYLIEKKGIIPRVYFSGAKGFHVFIDFPEIDLFFKKETLRSAANRLVNKLKLTCIDYQVIELARVSRIPLTVNSKTGYRCTPIDPKKFLAIDYDTLIHFCKYGYNEIEVHESKEFADLLRRIDMILITKSASAEAKRELCTKEKIILHNKNGNWKEKRIKYYAKVLKEKGYLSLDPKIIQIHTKNPHVDINNPGSIEHIARVHLVLLMIEEGYTDEQIHEVFKYAKDYDPQKTQKYIDYNRKWLANKKGGKNARTLVSSPF